MRFDDEFLGLPVGDELQVGVDVAGELFGDVDFFAGGELLREGVDVGAADERGSVVPYRAFSSVRRRSEA